MMTQRTCTTERTVLIALLTVALSALGAAPAAHAQSTPFNGKNLDGWQVKGEKNKSHWTVGTASLSDDDPRKFAVSDDGSQLVNAKSHGVDIYSNATFGDAIIELEVMVPKGSNSGIYVHGEYEIQVLDSWGKADNPGKGDMGAIYGASPPNNPVYKKPGEWSKYVIHFRAPRFNDAGKKVKNARFEKVVLNGQVIHRDVVMPGPTPGGVSGEEHAEGPLMFQGNHGPVAYRNIRIKPLK